MLGAQQADPGDVRRRRGHDRGAEPEPGGLAEPPGRLGRLAQLAPEADLTDRDQSLGDRASR